MAMEDPPFENRAIRETLDHTYQEQAARFLDFVRSTAAAAGLRCHTVVAVDAHPYNAIVDTANEHRCDLIVMTARHHHGLASLVMRSEAERVLHRSSIPVLTFRALMSADHPDHADRKPVNWLETFREYSGRDNPAARP
jgi:nucleotide-binding universal stress UspA family protein